MSVFSFVDGVSEVKKGESLTAFFKLKPREEYLKDHFADFPVMPGVLQLEALKQAASKFLAESEGVLENYRLQSVGAVKFGRFVSPGASLQIFVRFLKKQNGASFFEGRIDVMEKDKPPSRAVLADFSLLPVKSRSFLKS